MLHEVDVVPRLLVALALGVVIGLERQLRHQVAGLRTHALVALACALVMSVSQLLHNQVPLATGILTGVGFIGAGAVIRTEATVVGLSTAGTIWMVAALGITVGAGFYVVAVTAAALTLLTVEVLGWLEHGVVQDEIHRELAQKADTVRRQATVIDALTGDAHAATAAPSPAAGAQLLSQAQRRARWWRWGR